MVWIANGKTERFNGILIGALRKHALEDRNKWPSWIPYVLLAYRTKIHSTTDYAPFELMFGRQMNKFESWKYISDFVESEIGQAVHKSSIEIRFLVDEKQMKAKENITQTKTKQINTQRKNQKTADVKLEVGSQVYISTVDMHDKLYDKYKGPFTIVRISRSGKYVVKNVLGEELKDFFLERG